MSALDHAQVVTMLVGVGLLLAVARLLGELAKRFSQPAVLGELLAGILLGPTVLGAVAPDVFAAVFPQAGPNALVLHGFATLAVTLFMLVAGMEVDLSTATRQGKTAALVSVAGAVLPFLLGFGVAWAWPEGLGRDAQASPLIFALFFATALSISALPVIAKTLMDLSLYRSDFGMLVVAAAVLGDLFGWIVFAVVLRMMGATRDGPGILNTLWLTVGSAVFLLTLGRAAIHRALPWIQAHTTWPGGVIAFALSLALLGGAFTEWMGGHAIFGAFLVGVAVGDSPHLREHTRSIIHEFVSFIFAPLFFATIGLRVNFATHFDPALVAVVLLVACAGKILGSYVGARAIKLPAQEAWAVGFAMNARGAMEIILGLLASLYGRRGRKLQAGIIDERLFVALVVMALVTSVMSGPAMRRLLALTRTRGFLDYVSPRTFTPTLAARDKVGAIGELSELIAPACVVSPELVRAAVLEREDIMPTGLGRGIAVPHARLEALARPVLAVGLSKDGVDFDAPDGVAARVVFLLLTGVGQELQQIEIVADLAKTFTRAELAPRAAGATTYTEFLAVVRSSA